MRTSNAKRRSQGARRRAYSEWATAAGVVAVLLAGGYWMLDSYSLRMARAQLGLTTNLPVDVLGKTQCAPSCHTSLKRCQASTAGFTFQQSRCQETLKQCLIQCDGLNLQI